MILHMYGARQPHASGRRALRPMLSLPRRYFGARLPGMLLSGNVLKLRPGPSHTPEGAAHLSPCAPLRRAFWRALACLRALVCAQEWLAFCARAWWGALVGGGGGRRLSCRARTPETAPLQAARSTGGASFDPSASRTYSPSRKAFRMGFGQGSVSGRFCEDDVAIGDLAIKGFVFAEVFLGRKRSGIETQGRRRMAKCPNGEARGLETDTVLRLF